jgi:arabinose-5-phosphate isomerase
VINFILSELAKINFDEKVECILNYIDLKEFDAIVFCGVGKTSYIADRLASSYSSLGIRSLSLHAAEAMHGDLGRISKNDICVMLSYSGETVEILELANWLDIKGVRTLSVTGSSTTSLSLMSDLNISIPASNGISEFENIPSISLYCMQILFDMLLVKYAKLKSINQIQFAINHPGGGIGRKFKQSIIDVCHDISKIQVELGGDANRYSILMDQLQTNIIAIFDRNNFIGVLSSGDVRRVLNSNGEYNISESINREPVVIGGLSSRMDAIKLMNERGLTSLMVFDEGGKITKFITYKELFK